jgi:hypothetical protein
MRPISSMVMENVEENITTKRIELAFPKLEDESEYESKGPVDLIGKFSATVDEVTNWFKQYEIDSVELSISGLIETGNIIKLVISAKGEGGLKVTLKPKRVG